MENKKLYLGLFSLVAFVLIGVVGVPMLNADTISNWLDSTYGETLSLFELIGFLCIILLAVTVVYYISFIFWLVFAKFALGPNVVWQLARLGFTFKLDNWLITSIVGRANDHA